MNIERYLIAFERYQQDVYCMKEAMKRRKTVSQRSGYAVEMSRFVDNEEMEREYRKKECILAHATRRLQKAISCVKDPKLSDYLVCRYLYRMKVSEIADSFHFCERHMYRISRQAKKQLIKYLSQNLPHAKRWKKNARFTFRRKAKKRHRKYGPWSIV